MTLGNIFKFGLPLGFTYCTIYQQDIWREGDERLVEEQKRSWMKFFNLIDNISHQAITKLNIASEESVRNSSLVSKFESLNVKQCWNTKVMNTFAIIDSAISNPKVIACKIYRKFAQTTSNNTVKGSEEVGKS